MDIENISDDKSFDEMIKLLEAFENLTKSKKKKEKELKDLNDRIDALETNVVPTFMLNLGISEIDIKLENGSRITSDKKLHAKIPKNSENLAYKWLSLTGNSGIIKNKIDIDNHDDNIHIIKNFLESMNIDFAILKKIEPQTLKKFVKEELKKEREITADGEKIKNPIDKQLFGVYETHKLNVK